MDLFWTTAWVLVSSYYGLQYSPPMKTLEDCKRVQAVSEKISNARTECVEVQIQRKISRL